MTKRFQLYKKIFNLKSKLYPSDFDLNRCCQRILSLLSLSKTLSVTPKDHIATNLMNEKKRSQELGVRVAKGLSLPLLYLFF